MKKRFGLSNIAIALSSFIGIIGMTIFKEPFGIIYLTYYSAILCAIVVIIIDYKSRN